MYMYVCIYIYIYIYISNSHIKMFTYEWTQMVSLAQPFICKLNVELNIKLLSAISAMNVVIVLAGMTLFR